MNYHLLVNNGAGKGYEFHSGSFKSVVEALDVANQKYLDFLIVQIIETEEPCN